MASQGNGTTHAPKVCRTLLFNRPRVAATATLANLSCWGRPWCGTWRDRSCCRRGPGRSHAACFRRTWGYGAGGRASWSRPCISRWGPAKTSRACAPSTFRAGRSRTAATSRTANLPANITTRTFTRSVPAACFDTARRAVTTARIAANPNAIAASLIEATNGAVWSATVTTARERVCRWRDIDTATTALTHAAATVATVRTIATRAAIPSPAATRRTIVTTSTSTPGPIASADVVKRPNGRDIIVQAEIVQTPRRGVNHLATATEVGMFADLPAPFTNGDGRSVVVEAPARQVWNGAVDSKRRATAMTVNMKGGSAIARAIVAAQGRSFVAVATMAMAIVSVVPMAVMPVRAAIADMAPVPISITERAIANAGMVVTVAMIVVGVSVIDMHGGAWPAVGVIALII